MRIAQLSVAGEALSRPVTSESHSEASDQQALHDYACDRSNLPWVIFRAAHRATHTSALPARARALLAALARTVDASRPYAAIFARRELLTGRAQQSMRTFYRSMDDLEAAGFITRPPQTRYGAAGLFGRAYIHLTSKATSLLGLVDAPSDQDHASVESSEDVRGRESALPLASPSVTVADGAIYKDLSPTTQKRQPGRLPADLQRLQSLGFREFLIFKLMREAKQHGKLLSDVVEASWDHLRRATHPISYLRTLLRASVDFAYRVRNQRAVIAQQDETRDRIKQTECTVAHLAGRRFVSRDGLRTYRISDDARSITIHQEGERQPRVHAGAWAQDFVTALEAGYILRGDHIVEAPPTREASSPDGSHNVKAPLTASRTSSVNPTYGARLDELRKFLRLKRATAVPTMKPREAARPMNRTGSASTPLSSLLQAVSASAFSRK